MAASSASPHASLPGMPSSSMICSWIPAGCGKGRAGPWCNGVKLDLHWCKIACVARPGQQVVAGDRLADRIGIGVLAKVFPPELVDRVVDEAGVREQRTRTLPARVVVYYLLAMVLFLNSSYTEVWNKLVAGLDWARRFRVRLSLGMQPAAAAVTYARQRLGWQGRGWLRGGVGGALAGQGAESARGAGRGGSSPGRWRDRIRSARSSPGCGWSRWTGCAWTCRTRRRTPPSSATRAMRAAAGRSRSSAWSASANAGPRGCRARPPRAWRPGSSR